MPGRVVAGHTRYLRVATAEGETLAEPRGQPQAPGAERGGAAGGRGLGRAAAGGGPELRRDPGRAAAARGLRAAGRGNAHRGPGARGQRGHGLPGDGARRRLQPAANRARAGARLGTAGPRRSCCSTRPTSARTSRRSAPRSSASLPSVPVCVVAAKPGEGLAALAPWLQPGRTVVLLGSSGVGKSTLVNRLLGRERQRTREVIESSRPARAPHDDTAAS